MRLLARKTWKAWLILLVARIVIWGYVLVTVGCAFGGWNGVGEAGFLVRLMVLAIGLFFGYLAYTFEKMLWDAKRSAEAAEREAARKRDFPSDFDD